MKVLHSLLLATILVFSSSVFAEKVNINTASAEQISAAMTGVGDSKANAIVEYRNSNGKFKAIQDLENVDGIGSKTVDKNKENISL